MKQAKQNPPLILALDVKTLFEAMSFLEKLENLIGYVKIGPRLFALGGLPFVKWVCEKGYSVFLDLKLHDIPNTVREAVEIFCDQGLWALTLHTAGGRKMLSDAVMARDRADSSLLLFGVTVLTSLDSLSWLEVHPSCPMEEALLKRASICIESGMDGLVCSPTDLKIVRKATADRGLFVVPGIRPVPAMDDQSRTGTPRGAMKDGADFLVVGRPILQADDPRSTVQEFFREMEAGKKCFKQNLKSEIS